MPDVHASVLLDWEAREPAFRQYLANMPDASLLRLARCLWWEAIQHGEPFGHHDQRQLALAREECGRRGLLREWEPIEGEIRAELEGKGLLPSQRKARRQAG